MLSGVEQFRRQEMNSANTLTRSGWPSGDRSGCKIDTEMEFLNNLWGLGTELE
jgi:hypothetical protein